LRPGGKGRGDAALLEVLLEPKEGDILDWWRGSPELLTARDEGMGLREM